MKQIDDFLMQCEFSKHYGTEAGYTNDLRKYIMYYWNMPVQEACEKIDGNTELIHESYQSDFPIADLAQEIVEGFPSEEEAEAMFADDFDEDGEFLDDFDDDPEILSIIDDIFRHVNADKKTTAKKIKLKSKIDKIYPFDYSAYLRDLPATYIDPCNRTVRKIRCISDGINERRWLESDQDVIEDYDIDDITYYLDDVLENGPLVVGKEYTLIDAGIDYDVEMGLVWVKEMEVENGIPAFLFEEVEEVSVDDRVRNWDKHWDDEEDEEGF